MALNKLQDDLLQEFRDEKKMISNQIELFDPLAVSLRRPAAQRLAAKGLLIFSETICWAGMLGTIAFAVFLNKLYPFFLLFQLRREEFTRSLGANNVQYLLWSVYAMIGIAGFFLLLLARAIRRVRLKNDILNLAGKHIKTLVGQHLERKAAIDAIEQRHFLEIPQPVNQGVNNVPNPGYDGGSVEPRVI